MEYTFVKPVDTKLGLVYDWCLRISDPITLFMYEDKISGGRVSEVFHEEMYGRGDNGQHKGVECHLINMLQERDGKSWVESCADFFDKAAQGRARALEQFGAIYIQKIGSYFVHLDQIKSTAEKKVGDIVWPEGSEVRYLKWPNGTHWYAKIGNMDVKVDGNMKWDTKEEAEEAVKKII